MKPVILDAGPLVAWFCPRDEHHRWVRRAFTELAPIAKLLHSYADVPMDFADACVARLAELYPEAAVCTTDKDFLVYRRLGHERIPLIAPFGG